MIVSENTYVIEKEEKKQTLETTKHQPVLSVKDYKNMLKKAGFKVNIFGGYTEEKLQDNHKNICFVCRK